MTRLLLLICLALASLPGVASGHALQPGFLSVEPLAGESMRVFWRKPDVRGRPMQIHAVLPESCQPRRGPEATPDGDAWATGWVATCPGGLAGGRIVIEGLENTRTDVLVRFALADGSAGTRRLTPGETGFLVPARPGAFEVAVSYGLLGFDHILEGVDHLLFVLALILLVGVRWQLFWAITAFTAAHSLTLGMVTLGWVTLPSRPVEAVIALSILFLALEIMARRKGEVRLSERAPWLVTFAFGLLHGFGFAGALAEIGLPENDTPLALLAFNLGVEAGQLAFVAVVLALRWAAGALLTLPPRVEQTARTVPAYLIGSAAAYWLIERTIA
ncbi:MAG: HupE/UreJ family protein [Pseudomonadota bacterium]